MTRRMLINAHNPEELRIAVVAGNALQEFQLEAAERGLTRGNIYRGIVNNVQPSLNAAFINYGGARDGFVSMQDVVPEAYHRQPKEGRRPRIEEVLERGKPILIQVTRDSEGQKGAAVTTNVSLAGRYLVFTPYDDTHGVSRKVEDDEVRRKLKEQTASFKVPEGGGFIVRTNALDQTKATLQRDFTALTRLWKTIQTDFRKGSGPALLHNDQQIIIRTLRDYLNPSIEEVLIDDEAAFLEAEAYIRGFMPRSKVRVTRYAERQPLFSRYNLDQQIDRIYDRSVPLPSGGSIVIDRTEALIAIDVNSGRSTRAHSQEETAVNTNVEAAREVARQLRLRDIGGLVVVDFIDMRSAKHRQLVEKTLKDEMKNDKARSSVGRISSNGLLEVNRQRIQQALHLRTHRPCPTCSGTGRIASTEMVGLNLLRRIEARATTTPLERVRIALHPELADAFQNGRRREIANLEREFDMRIEIIASNRLHRPEEEIEWVERREPVKTAIPQAASAPRAEAEPHGDAANGNGKRKRRRRKKHRDTPLAGAESAAPSPASHDDHEEYEFDFEHEEDDTPEAEPSSGGVTAEPSSEQATGTGKRKRRRRKKHRDTHAPEMAAAPVAPGDEHDDDLEHDDDEAAESATSTVSAPEPGAAAAGNGKRKRRRRKKHRDPNAVLPPSAVPAPSPVSESDEDEGDDETPAVDGEAGAETSAAREGKRRRRRRGRKHRPVVDENERIETAPMPDDLLFETPHDAPITSFWVIDENVSEPARPEIAHHHLDIDAADVEDVDDDRAVEPEESEPAAPVRKQPKRRARRTTAAERRREAGISEETPAVEQLPMVELDIAGDDEPVAVDAPRKRRTRAPRRKKPATATPVAPEGDEGPASES